MNVYFDGLSKIGRLGNALFQLAATTAIAFDRGVEPRFNADWIHRPYFSVPDNYFTQDFRHCVHAVECPELKHINQRTRIYMQDVNLWLKYVEVFKSWLAPSELTNYMLQEFKDFWSLTKPILSVHIRRGDNVVDPGVPDKHNYFVLPTNEYYQNSIGDLLPYVNSVAVFSDDPAWCEQNIPADYYHHGVSRPKEHEREYLTAPVLDHLDLQLMRTCDYHIVTGSTFGIMAAILADTGNPVYRCSPVYGPKLKYVKEDLLFPSHWTKVQL